MTFPRMTLIQVKRRGPTLANAAAATERALKDLALSGRIHPGRRVAITAGSRGIAEIATITKTIVAALRQLKAEPVIIPAMGSHGGGTAEGQRQLLRMYGISEETMGALILSSMDVTPLGLTPEGIPVVLDTEATRADGILLVNRIKPHTGFAGRIGSGLLKMTVFGLGNHQGATTCHEAVMQHGYERVIRAVSAVVLARARILGGLAILENSDGGLAQVVALPAEGLVSGEVRLFLRARRWAPRLPFDDIDLLIVDEMGKDIAGTGMDTNVIGRRFSLIEKPLARPRIGRIFVRGLTKETQGNANGIGLADATTERLLREMDRGVTYINSLAARTPEHSRLPMAFPTDREALEAVLKTIRASDPLSARIVRIKNTLDLKTILISESLLPEARQRRDLSLLSDRHEVTFDPDGNLPPWPTVDN
ncbi:MAG TPA: lactate racemase domain-containing protein [Candidatus Methylomirabilis sp.]|nr:lactate racemase domain-containing protein [Candidatus Methylomirabilis sp.]